MRYLITLTAGLIVPVVAFAQGILGEELKESLASENVSQVVAADTFPAFVSKMMGVGNTAFTILITISLGFMFYGLASYFWSGKPGPEKATQAKSLIIWGLIGVLVLLSIFGLLNVVVGTFKFPGQP